MSTELLGTGTARRNRDKGGRSDWRTVLLHSAAIIGNDSVMQLAYTKYYRPDEFVLVNERVFEPLGVRQNHHMSTYYVFFDHKPE